MADSDSTSLALLNIAYRNLDRLQVGEYGTGRQPEVRPTFSASVSFVASGETWSR